MMRKIILSASLAIAVLVIGSVSFLLFDKNNGARPGNIAPPHTSTTHDVTTSPAGFDKTTYSTTDPASPWVIVNKKHPLSPLEYAPADLTAVGGGQYMRAEAAQALNSLIAGGKAAGIVLSAASGYRSYETQVSVYNAEVKSYGQATADSESARPGYSEHQTGLAVDIAGDGCNITDCFGNTNAGKWAAANAWQYGFILRYPADKVAITGYRNESWHFRYVGIKLSTELHNQNITTLEEFFSVSGGDYN